MTIYEVNYWGSHPDEQNDDCWTGSSFQNLADAVEEFETARERDGNFAVLTGPGIKRRVRQLVTDEEIKRENEAYEREWRREIAMEAGMLGGIAAYNDTMGY